MRLPAVASVFVVASHFFISYAHVDHEVTELVAQRIEGAGVRVWFDQRIDVGANWERMIEAAIEAKFRYGCADVPGG
ncbi:toll/interleukin-1 receptor domain-containing protein [Catelliglobosispora koreensis]|uniref:toll/interleukin-1 receptor domain-containing protein n=1 Tax=Catelliglobosispora koreensis TaxID=129052 RepID=UPI000475627B